MHVYSRIKDTRLTGYKAVAAVTVGAALTAVCAQISFHLPGNPIPVTMQTFAAVACGLVLGSRLGAIAQIQYLMLGMLGMPVFADGKAGLLAIAGPTGGYLAAFVVAAFLAGFIVERMGKQSFSMRFMAGFAGMLAIWLIGRAWFAIWMGDVCGLGSWILGVVPFIGVDIAKAALAAALTCGRSK